MFGGDESHILPDLHFFAGVKRSAFLCERSSCAREPGAGLKAAWLTLMFAMPFILLVLVAEVFLLLQMQNARSKLPHTGLSSISSTSGCSPVGRSSAELGKELQAPM